MTEQKIAGIRSSVIGSNREDLRQHNLSLIMRLVHLNRSITRSDLTAQTGLNRSTISDLVNELVGRGLVSEVQDPNSSGVGRPSLTVTATNEIIAFSVDITNYAVRIAAVGFSGNIQKRERLVIGLYPESEFVAMTIANTINKMRTELPKHYRVVGVGIAVPGQVDQVEGVIRTAHHLGWADVRLAEMLREQTNLPVFLGNDGSLSCPAERDFGAGRGFANIVYMYGGSGGIGGGVVVDNQLLRGAKGFAGELGHMRISDSKVEDTAGLPGTLEALVRREDLLDALRLDDVDDDQLGKALIQSRSPRVKKLLDTQVDLLGHAIGNLVNIFNPEVVLLAGFLSCLFDADDYRLLSTARQSGIPGARERVVIRKAELGVNLVLIGAAELAFTGLLEDPVGFELQAMVAKKK